MSMTLEDARDVLRRLVREIAPDLDLETMDPDEQLMEAGDLDSLDFIRLVDALERETGARVPERDFPRVSTISGFVHYVVDADPTSSLSESPPTQSSRED